MMAVSALALSACGDDDDGPTNSGGNNGGDDTIPSDWVGRWAGDFTTGNCGLPGFVGGEPDTFSICEGDGVVEDIEDIPGFEWSCDVNFSGTQGTWDCTGSGSIAGCSFTFRVNGTASRSGETMNISTTVDQQISGPDCPPGSCSTETGTYTRISTTPLESECGGEDPGDPGDTGDGNVTADITGSGVDVDFEATAQAVRISDSTYSVSAFMTDGTNTYQIAFTTPEVTSTPADLCLFDSSSGCVLFSYIEVRGFDSGILSQGTGSMRVTRADSERFQATFTASGDLAGAVSGARTLTGQVDVAVISGGVPRHVHLP